MLSSQKTRMDALKVFADLQQKYGEVLSGRTPDVQEANLGEKGIWYPRGRRPAGLARCSQRRLQSAEDSRLLRLLGERVLRDRRLWPVLTGAATCEPHGDR